MRLSKRARDYKEQVRATVEYCVEPMDGTPRWLGELALLIELTPPDKRARDVDNYTKAILDALEGAEIFENDKQVQHLEVFKARPRKPGRALIIVGPLGEFEACNRLMSRRYGRGNDYCGDGRNG